MTPAYSDPLVTVYEGDCLDVMRELPDASVDAVVTDPPYGLEFMGKEWDGPWKRGDDVNADAGFAELVMADGYDRLPRPSFTGSTNPKCSTCGGTRRGRRDGTADRKVCLCEDGGRFPNVRANEMRAYQAWCTEWATEAFRVLKPGGYLLAFGGTRTYHRLASAIEDAGFEIRDTLMWIYASGFPKSLDVSKALDKRGGNAGMADQIAAAIKQARESRGWTTGQADRHFCGGTTNWTWYEGRKGVCRPPTPGDFARIVVEWPELAPWAEAVAEAEREKIGEKDSGLDAGSGTTVDFQGAKGRNENGLIDVTAPATDLARKWEGWGTALKPAHEPIVMARKPLVGTVAQNVTRYGTGALNIDGSRLNVTEADSKAMERVNSPKTGRWMKRSAFGHVDEHPDRPNIPGAYDTTKGRWPSNVLLSSPELFDEPNPGVVGSGATTTDGTAVNRNRDGDKPSAVYEPFGTDQPDMTYGGGGGYSRFFRIPSRGAIDASGGLSGETPHGPAGIGEQAPRVSRPDVYPTAFIIPKADRAERERGLRGAEVDYEHSGPRGHTANGDGTPRPPSKARANVHPTVKPIDLMRHLVRLVTPPGGTVLDPFAGSGTTGLAASEEGFRSILIEREAEYVQIILGRLMATPMGLGLDVPAGQKRPPKTHPDLSKHQPKRRAPSNNWSGPWAGTGDEEDAA